MNFTAIDFETANRKRASACSIGMAKVRDGKIVDTYYELLSPETGEFEYINISVHGITPEMVQGKPTLIGLWDEIRRFAEDDVLVGHNVSFEQSVINQSFGVHGIDIPDYDYLCTLYMTRVNYPTRMGYKLDDVCKDLLGRMVNHHHALEDAIACADLAIHHISKFREKDPRELIKVLYETPQKQKTEWKKLTGTKPSKEELDPSYVFFDRNMVITGILNTMSREYAVQLLTDCGATYQAAVTKSTNYLVVGNQEYQLAHFGDKSSKMKKVEEMIEKGADIQIISEDQFRSIVVI